MSSSARRVLSPASGSRTPGRRRRGHPQVRVGRLRCDLARRAAPRGSGAAILPMAVRLSHAPVSEVRDRPNPRPAWTAPREARVETPGMRHHTSRRRGRARRRTVSAGLSCAVTLAAVPALILGPGHATHPCPRRCGGGHGIRTVVARTCLAHLPARRRLGPCGSPLQDGHVVGEHVGQADLDRRTRRLPRREPAHRLLRCEAEPIRVSAQFLEVHVGSSSVTAATRAGRSARTRPTACRGRTVRTVPGWSPCHSVSALRPGRW